jgi:hypothetical protein
MMDVAPTALTCAPFSPLERTTSIPIHPATLRGMQAKRSVTSALVLQALARLEG